ncbi:MULTISPECIES: transporter [unclassified Sphingomonas]|jgi:Putative MetA-pathway of phenol degradation|uniref:transporter n=1 Tax=unclassified Sphingomonas TaxID=196159 RepID=UPI000E109112|nr:MULTISPECIES: transporter [unclassified Sphingomonas]AXJ95067.1 transporter [Sphingomonas sp. FARSPH]
MTMRRTKTWIGLAAAATVATTATPALAQDDPRFCPTRPSIGGSSCTTEPGRVHVELSSLDWQRDDQPDQREDRIVTADLLTRVGVGKDTEVQLEWVGYGRDRTRDKAGGTVDTVTGTGDLTFAVRQHLAGEKGKPFSAGVQVFATAPTGRYPIGAGTWSTGVIIPLQYDLTEKVAVASTTEADAAANQSGSGRHLAYSEITGLRYKFTDSITATAELALRRDDDPDGHDTMASAALSAAWRPTKVVQLDILAVAGLNRAAPDLRLVTGGAILF